MEQEHAGQNPPVNASQAPVVDLSAEKGPFVTKVEPRTLKGFRDLLPEAAVVKEEMLGVLRGVFRSFAYLPIETPHLEYREVLVGQAEGDIGKQLYDFTDQGGRRVALRFDLTVPFARFAAQHEGQLGLPFKRYAIGEVFRGESPGAGRYREFTQCDFDAIGVSSVESDVETIQVIHTALRALGVSDFTIGINNRKLMNGYARHLGLEEDTPSILRIVDKIDKIGRPAVSEALQSEIGLTDEAADAVLNLFTLRQGSEGAEAFLAGLEPFAELDTELREGIDELRRTSELLECAGVPKESFRIDLSIARGLGYYTGVVFETTLNDLPSIGSVASGGRYNNLAESFTDKSMPGVGASIGLDRLLAALSELNTLSTGLVAADALFVLAPGSDSRVVKRWASQVRCSGCTVEEYPSPDAKMKAQFKYADRRGHPFVVIIGGDEMSRGVAKVKDMRDGAQFEVSSPEELATFLRQARAMN